jgi:hypothetical protein
LACGADPGTPAEDLGATEDPLYYKASRVWESGTISVCFEQTGFLTQRGWVQDAVEAAFEPLANIDFTGWGVCDDAGAQIVIRVGNDEWPRSKVGRRSASTKPWMFLNFFAGAPADIDGDGIADLETCWSSSKAGKAAYVGVTGRRWKSENRNCIEATAVHEFAHVLGVEHEQEREDTPADCTASGARKGGNTEYGYYDLTSVSNYCNPAWNGDGYLSPLDVSGFVSLYGMRTDDHVWYGIGDVADYGGASIHQAMFDIRAQDVGGNYHPFVGDFDGDRRSDMLWYGYDDGNDYVWFGEADRTFNDQIGLRQMSGGYTPTASDLDGDGRSDIYWHNSATGADRIWWGRTDRDFDRTSLNVPTPTSVDVPIPGDFDGDGFGDVFLYSSSGADRVLWGAGSRAGLSFAAMTNVKGSYKPLAGDFDADGFSDIFWYGRGSTADSIWWGRADRGFDKTNTEVSGIYDPTVADFDGNGASDILWSASTGSDSLWFFDARSRGSRISTKTSAILGGSPFGGDFDGDGIGDVFWYY